MGPYAVPLLDQCNLMGLHLCPLQCRPTLSAGTVGSHGGLTISGLVLKGTQTCGTRGRPGARPVRPAQTRTG